MHLHAPPEVSAQSNSSRPGARPPTIRKPLMQDVLRSMLPPLSSSFSFIYFSLFFPYSSWCPREKLYPNVSLKSCTFFPFFTVSLWKVIWNVISKSHLKSVTGKIVGKVCLKNLYEECNRKFVRKVFWKILWKFVAMNELMLHGQKFV